jgi:cytochrome o ubiquinol oxidase subunit 1
MFGKLDLSYLPHDPIIIGAISLMGLVALSVIGLLTYFKKWTWLYKEWLTTVDHKKIGIMYIAVATLMLLRGFADALMMRGQLVLTGSGIDIVDPEHFAQLFTAHGVIMIFFMAMPFMLGLFNLVVPLQIGSRDVAFPYLNALSFWLFVAGAMLVNISLAIGKFATVGWLAYAPLSGVDYSPGVGVDYYIWAIQITGLGSLISGINFVVTILKTRTPSMSLFKMPIFSWSVLVTSVLICIAFPILTVTLGLLSLDRYMGMHFFTSDFGGNPMLYINLIWGWGHPEVYILVLPAFGIFSEIASVFSRKRLFGYSTMVWALILISFLSFLVWVHHFFTMGAGGYVNAVFGIATMIIAIPTGVKVFNWIFTMYKGRIQFSTPMYWLIGFIFTFVLGGMTGVMLSIPASDFQFHNSLFLVAHFHNVIIGGVVFGYFAGFVYWFPKVFGFKLNEFLGKCAFFSWLIGFFVAFTPIYILGIMGATRRMYTYTNADWQIYFIIALFGTLIIFVGVGLQVLQVLVSVINRKKHKAGNDPWNGRTLEWSLPSPVPFYNFSHLPQVSEIDDFWYKKQASKVDYYNKPYEDIHMPRNTSVGLIAGIISFVLGFALVFHIWWLVIATFIIFTIILFSRSFNYNTDYYVKADEVRAIEEQYKRG